MKKKSNILIKRRRTHGTGDTLSDDDPRQVLPISMQTKNSFLPTTLWCSAFLVRQNKAYLQTTAIWFWKCKKNLIVITPSRGILHIKYIYMVVNDFLLWSAWWLTSANKFIYNREIWDLNYKEISNTWHSFVLLAYFKQFGQPFLENKSFTHAFSYFLFFSSGFDNKTTNTTFSIL